jgi:hypothetical protein
MQLPRTAGAALLIVLGLSGASDNPYFRLKQTTTNDKVRFTGTNTSGTPIVAYVVVLERAHQRVVWQGVYTEGDRLGTGKTIEVGEAPAGTGSEQAKVSVDYVRLADGASWGDATSDQAKEIAARFRK